MAQINVLTHHNDLSRTGVNYKESILTPENVNAATFGKVGTLTLDDQVYAQPLIFSNVNIKNFGNRNILLVCTVNNSVYAFDADNPSSNTPLWITNFNGTNVVAPRNTDMTGACGGNYRDFSGNMGIVGTPAIDSATQTMYVVARTKENGNTFVQKLHALNLFDGSEKVNSPIEIKATTIGTGDGNVNGVISFDPQKNNQRSALIILNGDVYICWASHCDWSPYHGWILGYNITSLQQTVVYNVTPDGNAGGIWMAGSAPATDGTSLFLTTGNGSVGSANNAGNIRNRGESALKLTKSGNTLVVDSWFTPYDYKYLEDTDKDLGSSGPVLIPNTNLMAFGGKGGRMYVVNRNNMGGLNTMQNDNQIVQSFDVQDHIHNTPVFWNGSVGQFMFIWSENDYLRSYKFEPSLGKFQLPASTSTLKVPGGMPGGFMSLSCNGNTPNSGILWVSHPLSGDANQNVVPGLLRAMDPTDVKKELWNSELNNVRDGVGNYSKFNPPTVANGKVYLATFSNKINIYGAILNTGEVNIAINKTATGSTTSCTVDEGVNKAFDGSTTNNSKWCINIAGDKWLKVDLGGSFDVTMWVVKHAGAGGEGLDYNTKDFKLQKSANGTDSWLDVDFVTGNTQNVTDRAVALFPAQYLRLYITNSGADDAGRIYEFEIYGKATITTTSNIAYSKATFSSGAACTTTETTNKAVDGTVANNSKWCLSSSGDKWIRVNLGQNYDITRWVVKHAGAGGENVSYNTKDFKLQKSPDGLTNWTDVDQVTGNTENTTDRNVPFASQHVRLFITNSGSDDAARIYEIEIYGTGSSISKLRIPENPAPTTAGLDYLYYEGSWNNLPEFSSITAVKTGTVTNFDIIPIGIK